MLGIGKGAAPAQQQRGGGGGPQGPQQHQLPSNR